MSDAYQMIFRTINLREGASVIQFHSPCYQDIASVKVTVPGEGQPQMPYRVQYLQYIAFSNLPYSLLFPQEVQSISEGIRRFIQNLSKAMA